MLSGTQRVRRDFSSYRRYGKYMAERIRVRIPRLTGRILGSYLHNLCDYGIQTYPGGRGLRKFSYR